MNAARLLQLYNRIADAPDAIARLRRFILDLAVRGKLVIQDANDEPAKGFKKPKYPAAPFELPSNWKWIELGDQLDLLNGMAFKPTDWSETGLRIVRIQNLNKQDAPFNFCIPEMARSRSLIDDGSFLISWSGTPGTSFGAFIWDRGPAVLNQHIFRCDFKTAAFIGSFLRLAINGRLDEMIAKAHGGVGLQHITKGKLEALLIPLPPLAEQHRIVAKVDELMALCDSLETARTSREATRDRLAAASLARLNAPTPETFEADARFALDALPALTTRPNQIKRLRQTILNLAVLGKLVSQDPGEEPAYLLRERSQEKVDASPYRRRIGGLIAPEKVPFECSPGWTWTTVQGLLEEGREISYGVIKLGDEPKAGGVPTLRCSDVRPGFIDMSGVRRVSESIEAAYVRTRLKGGEILINIRGTLGGVAVVSDELRGFNVAREVAVVPIAAELSANFIVYLMLSTYFWDSIQGNLRGIAYKGLNLGTLREFPVPLPPLAEQHRIVAKVDELMVLCDLLEASLTTADDTRQRLLEALLSEALSTNTLEQAAA
jgi:type I restriction enzyme S subunit